MKQFLTEEELIELTGAKQVSKQKEVLTANKIYFVERTDGKIKVCWYHVHHPIISVSTTVDDQINWDAA